MGMDEHTFASLLRKDKRRKPRPDGRPIRRDGAQYVEPYREHAPKVTSGAAEGF